MRRHKSLQQLYRRFLHAEIPMRAAALAFHSLLAIVPIFGILIWYLQRIGITGFWLIQTRNFLLDQLNLQSSKAFISYFEKFTGNVTGQSWGWIGLLIFIYTAFNLIEKFGESIDAVIGSANPHEVEADLLNYGLKLVRRLLILLGLPVALVISVGVSHWIREDSLLRHLFHINKVGTLFALPIGWMGQFLSLTLVYGLTPSSKIKWKSALKVAFLVAAATELLRWGLSVYGRYAVSSAKIYGVLAAIPMFILWVQLNWLLLLSGALFVSRQPSKKSAK